MDMSNKSPRSKKTAVNAGSKRPAKKHHLVARGAMGRSDEGRAFLPDPYDGAGAPARTGQNLAETLAEEYVSSATAAEEITEDQRDEVQTEELGGPFTETSAQEEFATEPDASNPIDAEREPFPTVTRPRGG